MVGMQVTRINQFFLCVETSLFAKLFIWKNTFRLQIHFQAILTRFHIKRFYMKTRFEAEAQGNLEMANWKVILELDLVL